MKTHLLDSSTPLIEGSKQVAICGSVVEKAVWVWQSESPSFTAMIQELNSMRMCQKCVRNSDKVTQRYAYLATDGESVLNPEAEVYLEEVKNGSESSEV